MDILDPTGYSYEFLKFHSKNKDKTEVDFLIFMIDKLKTEIETYKNLNFDGFKSELEIKHGKLSHKDEAEKQKRIDYELEKRIKHFRGLEHNCQRQIDFLNSKLNSFSSNSYKSKKNGLFEGKKLNLSERFEIAKKILNIETTIRTLNIPELKKYELLSFILDCNKDNARDLMNGKYNSKNRDLENYFDELGLNK